MKKNLLSVLILALLIVDIVLTSIMMVSIISTNGKTADLVTSVASALNLELYTPGGENANAVPLSQTATYTLPDRFTIQLQPNTDGSSAMIIFNLSLAMNTEHDDYGKLGSEEVLANFQIQIREAVESVVKQYSEEECMSNFAQVNSEILSSIQNLFQSTFIYRVSISDVMYQ